MFKLLSCKCNLFSTLLLSLLSLLLSELLRKLFFLLKKIQQRKKTKYGRPKYFEINKTFTITDFIYQITAQIQKLLAVKFIKAIPFTGIKSERLRLHKGCAFHSFLRKSIFVLNDSENRLMYSFVNSFTIVWGGYNYTFSWYFWTIILLRSFRRETNRPNNSLPVCNFSAEAQQSHLLLLVLITHLHVLNESTNHLFYKCLCDTLKLLRASVYLSLTNDIMK